MFQRKMLIAVVALASAWPAWAAPHRIRGDHEPNPQRVLHQSMHRLNRVTRHTVQTMLRQAGFCARHIERLIGEGNDEVASNLADRCTQMVNHMADVGTTMVSAVVERGVSLLTELDAPEEMAATLQEIGTEKSQAIADAQNRAIQRIQDALNGAPPDES